MQDFTGVPAIADLASMRNALKKRGLEPKIINPLSIFYILIIRQKQVSILLKKKVNE